MFLEHLLCVGYVLGSGNKAVNKVPCSHGTYILVGDIETTLIPVKSRA